MGLELAALELTGFSKNRKKKRPPGAATGSVAMITAEDLSRLLGKFQ
jgi:hypothetical protein